MTSEQINAAVDRMPPEIRDDLKKIVYGNSPTKVNEARTMVELFHYFRFESGEEEPQISTRSVVQDQPFPHLEPRAFVRDEVQREWEAWT